MTWWSLVGFGLAVLPICLTPGVSFTLVTQRVLSRGRASGVAVTAGTVAGLVCHATLAGIGLSALVMRSSELFTAVKLAGAAYLLFLGARMLWRSRRTPAAPEAPSQRLPWAGHGDLVQGFLGNVLNPKAAAVYLTLAPQFVHRGSPLLPQMLALSAAQAVVVTTWLLLWTGIVWHTRRALQSPLWRRTVDRVMGSVMVALGVRTAAASR